MKRAVDGWHQYQEEAAKIFRSFGLNADTDVQHQGDRGVHRIDVVVRFQRFGAPILWLVECKPWKCPVAEEKVLRLFSVAQDMGADKGFLLSESGFLADAVRSASSTNVVLTDLQSLESTASTELAAIPWRQAQQQIEDAIEGLGGMVLRPKNPTSHTTRGLVAHAPPGFFDVMGRLAISEHEILLHEKDPKRWLVGFEDGGNPVFEEDLAFFADLENVLGEAEDLYRRFTDSTPTDCPICEARSRELWAHARRPLVLE